MSAPARKPSRRPPVTTTTTVKLPADTKARLTAAAEAAGKTTHAFMVEAIESATDRAELRRSFIAEALAADAEFDRTGEAYEAEALFDYLEKRAAGKNRPHPKPVKWRK